MGEPHAALHECVEHITLGEICNTLRGVPAPFFGDEGARGAGVLEIGFIIRKDLRLP